MKCYLYLTLILLFSNSLFSQAPPIVWQSCFGGTNHDTPSSICETADGGTIILGSSLSNNGDVSGNYGLYDVWIIKLDLAHNLVWQKSLGGTLDDFGLSVISTPDGNLLLGGRARSNNGDVTGNHGNFDCWLIKMDTDGNILWKNCYGGTQYDELNSIVATDNGGYIFAGRSHSNNGNVTGHHGTAITSDVWVVKIDDAGAIEWQKSFGGSDWDVAEEIIETADGYVFTGYSSSADGDANANFAVDYWIVKIDFSGNIIWSKTYGGSNSDNAKSIIALADGNYVIVGSSSSWNGDVTGHHGTDLSSPDIWVLKLNSSGNVLWKKSFGGLSIEYGNKVLQYSDNLLLIAGYTQSIDGDLNINPSADGNVWTIAVNYNDGSINWQSLEGGNPGGEQLTSAFKKQSGEYIFAANAMLNNGLITNAHGFNDFWIFTWATDCIAFEEICNALDDNCNGLIDDDITETVTISADGATTFCQGENILLSSTYSGASIQWKKNGTNIPGATSSTYSVNKSGNYSAITTSPCGTAISSIINITVNKNPPASITAAGTTTFCAGGSVVLTANTGGGLSYQWFKGASLLVGATSINYTATIAGNYKCRVTKTATGCFKNSNAIAVTVPCKEGEELATQNTEIEIYPNPNNGTFILKYDFNKSEIFSELESVYHIAIFNNVGESVFVNEMISSNGIINEQIKLHLPGGIYFVKISNGNNVVNQKIIIQ